jgi:hypothetical protein
MKIVQGSFEDWNLGRKYKSQYWVSCCSSTSKFISIQGSPQIIMVWIIGIFCFLIVQKQYAFSRNCSSGFEFCSFPRLPLHSMIFLFLGNNSEQSVMWPVGETSDTVPCTVFNKLREMLNILLGNGFCAGLFCVIVAYWAWLR